VPPAEGPFAESGEEGLLEELEMMGLAEKLRLIGRDAVQHLLAFAAARVAGHQVVVILRKGATAEVTQPLPQAGADQFALDVG
jgi:hypothetical protein